MIEIKILAISGVLLGEGTREPAVMMKMCYSLTEVVVTSVCSQVQPPSVHLRFEKFTTCKSYLKLKKQN